MPVERKEAAHPSIGGWGTCVAARALVIIGFPCFFGHAGRRASGTGIGLATFPARPIRVGKGPARPKRPSPFRRFPRPLTTPYPSTAAR